MREILLLPWTLGKLSSHFSVEWLDRIESSEDVILILKHFDQYCNIAGLVNELNSLYAGIRQRGIQTIEVDDDCFERYLLNHKTADPIFISPVPSTEIVISIAVSCAYMGSISMIGNGYAEPPLRPLTSQIRAFAATPRAGIRGLDRREVEADHAEGRKCHYTLNGKRYEQNIGAHTNQGAEGFVFNAAIEGYILKIWDIRRFQFSNDKIKAMLCVPENKDIALPLAFVYNDADEPIGIVMRFFEGKTATLDRLYEHKNPLSLCRDIITQLIWLESRGFMHWDFWHNVIIGNGKAHIIDLDSVQFAGYPATAESQDVMSYIPAKFEHNAAFGSTISIAYNSLSMLIQLYLSKAEFNSLLWDENHQHDTLNTTILQKLPETLQSSVVEAYAKKQPVSLLRQLHFVTAEIEKPTYIDPVEELWEEFDDELDDQVLIDEVAAASRPPQNSNSPNPKQIRSSRSASGKSWFVCMIQKFIIWLCGGISGTIPHSYGSPADTWDIFVSSGVWKKPLAISIICCFTIFILIIALLFM